MTRASRETRRPAPLRGLKGRGGGALRISATAHPLPLRPCRRPANNCAEAVHCTSCREVRLGDVCVPVAAKSRGARYTVMRSVSLLP